MNQTITDLVERRSIRAYAPRQISDAELELILTAGTFAPSGMGKQSARIVAVQDRETRDQLSRMNAEIMGANGDPFYGAPTVLVVLADRRRPTWKEDGSLVLGNLLNAAHAIGVDSCWIHRAFEEFESAEGRALLQKWGIGGHYAGVGHCVLGYRAADYPQAAPRKKDYVTYVK